MEYRGCFRRRKYIYWGFILNSILIIYGYIKSGTTDHNWFNAEDQGVMPCGEICTYAGNVQKATFYPYIQKYTDCVNILRRMATTSDNLTYPPPKEIPADLLEAFTQNGNCPIKGNTYLVDFKPNTKQRINNISTDKMNEYRNRDHSGIGINPYRDKSAFKKVLMNYTRAVYGARGFIIGTIIPWIEALMLNIGAQQVTTLDIHRIQYDYPNIEFMLPSEASTRMLEGSLQKFNFGVSYGSVQHFGLGRYGDPINPYGDLEAMAQAWCMTMPGGMFFLAVPVSYDNTSYIEWNARRVYGHAKLQHLTANWEVVDVRQSHDVRHQGIIVLRKPKE